MNSSRAVFLSILAAANLILYASPFVKSRDVDNFDLKALEGRKQFGDWRVTRDVGASEIELKSLQGSKIVRYNLINSKGKEVQFVLVVNNFRSLIHAPTDCLPAQGWVIESKKAILNTEDGDVVPVNSIVTHFKQGERVKRELLWYWYAVYKDNFNSHFGAVLYNAVQRAIYGRKYNWALVRLSTNVSGTDETQEISLLKDFLVNMYPAVKEMKDSVR